MKKPIILLYFSFLLMMVSCTTPEDPDLLPSEIVNPLTYNFLRNGQSSVDIRDQTFRILMAEELVNKMLDFSITTEAQILELYTNQTAAGGDANPFQQEFLNQSTVNVRDKIAASKDYFFDNLIYSLEVKDQIASWISSQIKWVFPRRDSSAVFGKGGVLPDGPFPRYLNSWGIDYKEAVSHSIVGALMVDQIVNHYLSFAILEEGFSQAENRRGTLVSGTNSTYMERVWDQAYGYAYGGAMDPSDPNLTIGFDDPFLNAYIGSVDADPDFEGIAEEIFEAFKLGRAAIVALKYRTRDEQISIIQRNISQIIAIKAVYFLQQASKSLKEEEPNLGTVFYELSRAYGAIYSLQFTRNPDTGLPYFSRGKTSQFLTNMISDGQGGFWNLSPSTVDSLSEIIASPFEFTVIQAAEN